MSLLVKFGEGKKKVVRIKTSHHFLYIKSCLNLFKFTNQITNAISPHGLHT